MGINQARSVSIKNTPRLRHVFLTGIQALVRLPMAQIRRDRAAGLNTAGFISGYRGSRSAATTSSCSPPEAPRTIQHQVPARRERGPAATAIWGSQQLNLSPGANYDGAVGIWYGKGPASTAAATCSATATRPAQPKTAACCACRRRPRRQILHRAASVRPRLHLRADALPLSLQHPRNDRDGLLGIAMSRYSGCWVGMKVITETVETTAEIDLTDEMTPFVIPTDFEMPRVASICAGPTTALPRTAACRTTRAFAAIAFARANKVNASHGFANARYGIMASGKSYEDIRQALRELGVTPESPPRSPSTLQDRHALAAGAGRVRQFAVGLEEIFIIEERREIVENQVKQELFNWRDDVRPRIIGKMDDHDKRFLPFAEELSVASLASSLTERLLRLDLNPEVATMLRAKADWFNGRQATQMQAVSPISRTPYSARAARTTPPPRCRKAAAPCRHRLPFHGAVDGPLDRDVLPTWRRGRAVGRRCPFTKEEHVFANLGDGTYFHSGSLAIRQAIASGANITYKILYNDATAMTGGQHVDANCRRSRSPSSFIPKASATSIWSRKIPTPIRRTRSRPASRPRIATNSTRSRRRCAR